MTATTATNLWGNLPESTEIKPPLVFLREQASILGQLTSNVLQGDVQVSKDGSTIAATLDIVAPALDNYRFRIVSISHGISFYPVTLTWHLNNRSHVCPDEKEFLRLLQTYLSSPETHKIIGSLVAQSKLGWGGASN